MMERSRKGRYIIEWLKDPLNAVIASLCLLLVGIRVYYFVVTLNQPVWWDEGDYLNIARLWAFGHPGWDINPLRPLLFPLVAAFVFKVGGGEFLLRVFVLL